MKKRNLEEDYKKILELEGLDGWLIRWDTGGGLCVKSEKKIWMGSDKGDIALFLHEVAHALCPKEKCGICWSDNTGHNAIWGDCFTSLVRKYVVQRRRGGTMKTKDIEGRIRGELENFAKDAIEYCQKTGLVYPPNLHTTAHRIAEISLRCSQEVTESL